MHKILVFVAVAWRLLLPPLFTGGDCTREFEAEARRAESDRDKFRTLEAARAYWTERGMPYSVLAYDQCRKSRPRCWRSAATGRSWSRACRLGARSAGSIAMTRSACSSSMMIEDASGACRRT